MRSVKVLLIEDSSVHHTMVQGFLAKSQTVKFNLLHADRLSVGLQCLETEPIDVVLLDLGLPDSQGLNTFHEVFQHAKRVPIVVLTGTDDLTMAAKAVEEGLKRIWSKGKSRPRN